MLQTSMQPCIGSALAVGKHGPSLLSVLKLRNGLLVFLFIGFQCRRQLAWTQSPLSHGGSTNPARWTRPPLSERVVQWALRTVRK